MLRAADGFGWKTSTLRCFSKGENEGNQPEAPIGHLRPDLGLWKSRGYLGSMATWESFSATPSVNGLSPVLRAVPNLSISHDETFSVSGGSFGAATSNLSA